MAFDEDKFHEIDPNYRLYKSLNALTKVGLFNNLGEKQADNMVINYKQGLKIC